MKAAERPRSFHIRDVWGCSYLINCGLELQRVDRLEASPFRAVFVVLDPDGKAPQLMRQFRDDPFLQRFLAVRKVLSHGLDVARVSGTCDAAETLGDDFASAGIILR